MGGSISQKLNMKVLDLPSLPHITTQLVQMTRSPSVNAAKIGELISTDQALTSKVLRVINSAFYALPQKVSTVSQAVMLLGFNAVRSLVISATVVDLHSGKGGLDRHALWLHAMGTAVAAKMLTRHTGKGDVEEAFTAGLLHDVGKVIIDRYFHRQLEKIVELCRTQEIPFYQAEQTILGVSHDEVGGWAAEHWNLAQTLSDPIIHHHHPAEARLAPEMTAIVSLADVLCRREAIGSGGDSLVPTPDPVALQLLQMSTDDLDTLSANLKNDVQNAESLFSL